MLHLDQLGRQVVSVWLAGRLKLLQLSDVSFGTGSLDGSFHVLHEFVAHFRQPIACDENI